MIIKYHPRYLKAIKDISRRDGIIGKLWEQLEIVIRKNQDKTYIYIDDKRKFRGYISYMELPDGTLFCSHWSSKSPKEGIVLGIHSRKDLRDSYDEFFYYRDKIMTRRKI